MNGLSSIATKNYYEITRESYLLGLISWGQVLHRLAFLYELSEDSLIKKNLFFIAGNIIAKKTMEEIDCTDMDISPEFEFAPTACPFNNTNSSPLALTIKGIGKNSWKFNQYDHDYFPSIPHGKASQGIEKLDVYLGWIYNRSKQVERIKRKEIIFLWNDGMFRKYALNSISWYMITYPKYQWRVPNPRKIPRKVKG